MRTLFSEFVFDDLPYRKNIPNLWVISINNSIILFPLKIVIFTTPYQVYWGVRKNDSLLTHGWKWPPQRQSSKPKFLNTMGANLRIWESVDLLQV